MNLRNIDLSSGQTTTFGSGTLQDPRFSLAPTNRSIIVGNLGAPLVGIEHDVIHSLDHTAQFDIVSDDPLTTGIALEFFHSHSIDVEPLPV